MLKVKSSYKVIFTSTVLIIILVVIVTALHSQLFTFSSINSAPVKEYMGIKLTASMDEVKYILGVPTNVLYEDHTPIKLADGTTLNMSFAVATKEEIAQKKGVDNFFMWHYDMPNYRIDVSFDESLKVVTSIACYVSDKSEAIPTECNILGLKIKDDESSIVEKLGKPSEEKFSGVTKTLFYHDIPLKLHFEKKKLYYIVAGLSEKTAMPKPSNPSYDDEGWTQESTNSKDVGPWLKYSPKGSRYCRYSDGTIYRLYPPGMKPEAEKANPFCLGGSTANIK